MRQTGHRTHKKQRVAFAASGAASLLTEMHDSLKDKNSISIDKQSSSQADMAVSISAEIPISTGRFFLFNNYLNIETILADPSVADFFALTAKMRSAVKAQSPTWALNKDFVDYANICHWMIRKLEYSFAIKAFLEIERDRQTSLRILDLGCGVVPLCNYLSLRKHVVIAADPDADAINFSKEHLNGFFGSAVDYRVASAEQLPFPDNSFDVVLMVSVLEHIPPGNDRLALSEAARVLKPDGHLIITFDVSPPQPPLDGEPKWEEEKRRFNYPFSPHAAARLLDKIQPYFDLQTSPLPAQFAELSWDDVHNFWRDNQNHDERDDPIREYLAMGATLKPVTSINPIQLPEIKEALLEGQSAIAQQLALYQYHANQRLQVINQLSTEIDRLRVETEGRGGAILQTQQEAQRIIKYQDELTLAQDSLLQKEAEIAYLRHEIHRQFSLLEQQLNAIRETYDEKEIEAGFLKTKLNEAESEIRTLRLSNEEKHLQLNQLAAQFCQIQTQFQDEMTELRSIAEAKQKQLDHLSTQSQQNEALHKKEAENLRLVAETKQKQIEQLKLSLQNKADEIDQLETQFNGEKEKLLSDLSTTREQLAALKAQQEQLYVILEGKQQLVEATQRTIEEQTRVFEVQQEAHAKSFENANLIAEARLRVIEEQQAALERLRSRSLRERVKRHITPQLGVLYQYPPRPIALHQKYYKESLRSVAPTISIVTPSFNQGGFIERTIRSVLDQTYPNLEYIIQDGASSDETMDVVQKYSARLKHYESVKDTGQTNALNLGFRHATGEIMAYLNSDDLLLPGSLNFVANYFSQHPEVDVIYGHRIIIDEYDQEVGRWVMPAHNNEVLSWADYVPQETLFWRRNIWEKAGGTMDESFRFAMDWDLILRMREAKARFVRVPRYLGAFRIHPHQKTSAQMTEIGMQEMNRLRERSVGRQVTHHEISHHTRAYMIRHILLSRFVRLIERFQKNTVTVSYL